MMRLVFGRLVEEMAEQSGTHNDHGRSLRSTTATKSLYRLLDCRRGRCIPVVAATTLRVDIVDTFLAICAALGGILAAMFVQAVLVGLCSQFAHIRAVPTASCHQSGN
eukprot:COSAG02_NODE_8044_length_2736_cov_5.792188_2_plen_108_part_00